MCIQKFDNTIRRIINNSGNLEDDLKQGVAKTGKLIIATKGYFFDKKEVLKTTKKCIKKLCETHF